MATGYPVKANYATGDVLTAANMNDLAGTVNFAVSSTPTTATQMAGKNKIINGDFSIWQRGTTTNLSASTATYLADRFTAYMDSNAGTFTYSRQSFTPGTAPVAGYEGTYFARLTTGGNCNMGFSQLVEDVRTFAGQTVTFSFWAKASTSKTVSYLVNQNFGTGGSTSVNAATGSINLTTSWQRFSITFLMPSVSGKTIGTNSYLLVRPMDYQAITGNVDFDFWGVQLETGSSATPFQTATGTIQGELAACQRYYERITLAANGITQFTGNAYSTTAAIQLGAFKVSKRVAPTSIDYSGIQLYDSVSGYAPTAFAIWSTSSTEAGGTLATGATGLTQYRNYLTNAGGSGGYLGFSAEL